MPLIKDGRVIPDPWIFVGDDAPLPATGAVIVTLPRFRAETQALWGRGAPLGVRLQSSQLAHEIGAEAGQLGLIALEFETFRDGRPYSTARLLRQRWGFRGELRGVGDVLRDQLLFMHRCGFDAFELADERAVEGWRKAMTEFSIFYQTAADGRLPARALRDVRRVAE